MTDDEMIRLPSGRPMGLPTPAWKGCECVGCRRERREMFGREDVDMAQETFD